VGEFNNGQFGSVTGAREPRNGQLALKLLW
jgi:hypothetical protein